MDKSFVAFLVVGLLLVGTLLILQSPVESIPPTNAFNSINGTDGEINATKYNENLELIEGTNIDFDFDNVLKELTITASGGNSPNELYCSGTDKFNSYNATTNIFTCDSDVLGVGGEANTITLISANETDQTVTVLNSDSIVRTYSLANNTYSRIIVESEVEVSFGVLSIPQDVLIKIKNGGATQETVTAHPLAQIGTSAVPIKVSFVQTGSATITITQSGITSDANTNVLVHSIRIYGVT